MANDKLKKLLEERKAILDARSQQEQTKEAAERKIDTRRKILVGAAILHKASGDKQYETWLINNLLNGFLTKPDDRALFNLPPLSPTVPIEGDNQNRTI